MALWGSSTGFAKKPTWTAANTSTPYPGFSGATREDYNDMRTFGSVYADNSGWKITLPSSNNTTKTEQLVAIRGLASKMAAANVTLVYFDTPYMNVEANIKVNVVVCYSQQVQFAGAFTPFINVSRFGSFNSNDSATYISGNTTNKLIFQFTTASDFAQNTVANVTLTIPPISKMNLIEGNIRTVLSATVNASVWLPNSSNTLETQFPFVSSNARGSFPQLNLIHDIPQLSNIRFAVNSIARSTASNLFLNYSNTVYIYGSVAPNLVLYSTNTTSANVVATYASGNGTTNLRFSFTSSNGNSNLSVQNTQIMNVSGRIISVFNASTNSTITGAIANTANVLLVAS